MISFMLIGKKLPYLWASYDWVISNFYFTRSRTVGMVLILRL